MKILLVANINSPHTKKWALALAAEGQTIGLFSLDPLQSEDWTGSLSFAYSPTNKSDFLPLRYIKLYSALKKQISNFQPDLLHAHYLTNYGFIASIAAPHLLVSTAWGSDIFEFPKQSFLNKWVLKLICRRSLCLISTSNTMAEEMKKYTRKPVKVIPFGIDFTDVKSRQVFPSGDYNIACFKKLEKVYGINLLIRAFKIVTDRCPDQQFKLYLYGEGSQKQSLQALSAELGLSSQVHFQGWLPPEKIYNALAQTDLCVYLSERESFGVALIEAMAAGCPLVVSDLPAFREVVGPGAPALFLKNYSAEAASEEIMYALFHPNEMKTMTETAQQSVLSRYQLKDNIRQQIQLYLNLLPKVSN